MKIGVIADTHIPLKAQSIPKQILEAFKGVDMIIHAGDLVNLEVLGELKKICSNVKAVWGNMDPEAVRKKLPEKEVLKVDKYTIGVSHGCGAPDNLPALMSSLFEKDKPDLIIFGHSHSPLNEEKDGIIFFNPGSPVDKVFAPYNSYGIIEINDKIKGRIIKL